MVPIMIGTKILKRVNRSRFKTEVSAALVTLNVTPFQTVIISNEIFLNHLFVGGVSNQHISFFL